MKSEHAPTFYLPVIWLTKSVRLEAKLTEMMCVFTLSSRVTPSSSLHFSAQSVSLDHNLTVQKLSVLRILAAPSIIFIQQKLLVLSDVEIWCPLGLRVVVSKVWSLKPAAASLENLLEMQIPVSHPRTNESEPRGIGAQKSVSLQAISVILRCSSLGIDCIRRNCGMLDVEGTTCL